MQSADFGCLGSFADFANSASAGDAIESAITAGTDLHGLKWCAVGPSGELSGRRIVPTVKHLRTVTDGSSRELRRDGGQSTKLNAEQSSEFEAATDGATLGGTAK